MVLSDGGAAIDEPRESHVGATHGPAFVSKPRYLTARCPGGCESWLHPRAVASHLSGRCRGESWVEEVDDCALVPRSQATVFLDRLPSELVSPAAMSLRDGRYRRQERFRYEVLQGIIVRSPIQGVRARRWLYVVSAAMDRLGGDAIVAALTPTGFEELQQQFPVGERLFDCPDCGETVKRSLGQHRTRSSLCRWRRAQHEVRVLWASGWRDPFSISGAPTTWTALQAKASWRRRTRTVEFPRWIAVLLSPGSRDEPGGAIRNSEHSFRGSELDS